jgi:hypothetical protein
MHPHAIALSSLGLRTGLYARLYLHICAAIPCPSKIRHRLDNIFSRLDYWLQTRVKIDRVCISGGIHGTRTEAQLFGF